MKRLGTFCAAGVVVGTMAGGVLVSGQNASLPEPRKGFGASVTGAFEGWYYNEDGSRTFLLGYYNRNLQQELDVPIGPNNRIDPGGPDMGQPTHFLPGRQWGMFAVPVPKDFKEQDSLTWTITANGQTNTIPLRLKADYVMSPFKEIAVGNTPPAIRFEPAGSAVQGPLAILARAPARTASLAAPLELTVWAADDMKFTNGTSAPMTTPRPPVTVRFSKYRGPGPVTFDKPRPTVEKLAAGEGAFSGKATTSVKFGEPGDYVLHVTANDYSGDGGGGFGCCWTTSVVKVAVKP
ncbi:MAG: hypothetical protein DMF94_23140 [Acidobacteria bacterium]|nr:MAG: hypothetical protein DMF96_27565 [Acidobacteriota bacterium]PYR17611.1 MAG: hypothetical protein DMF94_23140 [Acidobacteriota bacterium]